MEVPLSQKVDASFASIGGSTQRGRLRIAQHDDPGAAQAGRLAVAGRSTSCTNAHLVRRRPPRGDTASHGATRRDGQARLRYGCDLNNGAFGRQTSKFNASQGKDYECEE
jgi:hypothetical protein